MPNPSWEVWRIHWCGRPVATVHRTRLGYWLTPTVTSGVLPSTSLHGSAQEVQDALARRFGDSPDRFAFHEREQRS
jgi:hypothetical protein